MEFAILVVVKGVYHLHLDLLNYPRLLQDLYLWEEKHIDSRYEIIAQRPKGIKWSAVPLPCSTFFLVFMGGSRAAA